MNKLKSELCVALSAICYGIQPTFITLFYANGGNSYSMNFFLCILGALFMGLIVVLKKKSFKISVTLFKKLFVQATFGSTGTCMLLYYSYSRISSGLATCLHYIYPIVVALSLVLFFGEKMTLKKGIALLLAVIGIVLISGYQSGGIDLLGIAAALLSGVCWGFYITYMEKSGIASHDSYVMNFYISLISIPECGLLTIVTGSLILMDSPLPWIFIILTAVVGRLLAAPLFQKGIHGTGAMTAGVLSTLEPITALVLSCILSKTFPSLIKILGALLVLGGACLIVFENAKASTENE